jgi:hypothetical protein
MLQTGKNKALFAVFILPLQCSRLVLFCSSESILGNYQVETNKKQFLPLAVINR